MPALMAHDTTGVDLPNRTTERASLSLLDAFRLEVEARPVDVPRPAQRLLAYLAVRSSAVCRERVAGDLWPDLEPSDALARLRDALYRLRQAGPGLVDSPGMWLSLGDHVRLDLRRTWRRARTVLAAEDIQPRVTLADLAPRQVLPSWDESWLAAPRHDLWLTCVRAVECMAQDRADEGCFLDAEVACRLVIDAEPYRESAYLLLADVYLAEGNPGQAWVVVRDYQARMRSELGLDVGPAVAFVQRSIHRRASGLSESVGAGARRSPRRARPPH